VQPEGSPHTRNCSPSHRPRALGTRQILLGSLDPGAASRLAMSDFVLAVTGLGTKLCPAATVQESFERVVSGAAHPSTARRSAHNARDCYCLCNTQQRARTWGLSTQAGVWLRRRVQSVARPAPAAGGQVHLPAAAAAAARARPRGLGHPAHGRGGHAGAAAAQADRAMGDLLGAAGLVAACARLQRRAGQRQPLGLGRAAWRDARAQGEFEGRRVANSWREAWGGCLVCG
jgi:hypothetical protein